MDFLRGLWKTFFKIKDTEEISKQLAALIKH